MMKKIVEHYFPGEIAKAESRAYDLAEREFNRKITDELQKQRGIYDLRTQQLNSEIMMLNRLVDDRNRKISESIEKELSAKSILLKAQEIATQIEVEYRQHTENNTRTMVRFKEIRFEAEKFARQLLPQNP